MSKPLQDRIDNWLARMAGEAVSPATLRVLDPKAPVPTPSTAAYISTMTSWQAFEDGIRAALGSAGIPILQYPFYLSFGRQLFRLVLRGYSFVDPLGIGMVEAQTLTAAWVARGLEEAVLNLVLGLFANVAPAGAPVPSSPPNHTGHANPNTLVVGAVSGATAYDFRIFRGETLVEEEDNSPTPAYIITPDLPDGINYHWDCRAYVGYWTARFSPKWEFYVLEPI